MAATENPSVPRSGAHTDNVTGHLAHGSVSAADIDISAGEENRGHGDRVAAVLEAHLDARPELADDLVDENGRRRRVTIPLRDRIGIDSDIWLIMMIIMMIPVGHTAVAGEAIAIVGLISALIIGYEFRGSVISRLLTTRGEPVDPVGISAAPAAGGRVTLALSWGDELLLEESVEADDMSDALDVASEWRLTADRTIDALCEEISQARRACRLLTSES